MNPIYCCWEPCSKPFRPDHPRRLYCSESCVKEVKKVYLIAWRNERRKMGIKV